MKWHRLQFAAILSVHLVLIVWMAARDAPTWDESAHLPAGISHWQLGRFDLYCVNPPLVRMVAAPLPILFGAETDWSDYSTSPTTRSDFKVGTRFINENGSRIPFLFFLSRLSCIPFTLLGACVCYLWAKRLFGKESGILALTMWCFAPNILAWGHTIMPDIAATSCGALVFYRFQIWLENRTWSNGFYAGIAMGLALATKGTWLLLFPLLPVFWIMSLLVSRNQRRRPLTQLAQLSLLLFTGLLILNLIYGFDGSFTRLDRFEFVGRPLSGRIEPTSQHRPVTGNRFDSSTVGALPVPVPFHYLRGIDWIQWEFERGYPSWLRGEWKQGSWWYYYLYCLAVKMPLGYWGLLICAILAIVCSTRYRSNLINELFVCVPGIFLLLFVSLQTGFGHHLRYVLPIYPFLIVFISRVAISVRESQLQLAIPSAVLLTWSIISSLIVFPHSLSYYNELAGGPKNGYHHLLGSNTDSGQDLYYVKRWQLDHPEAKPFYYSHSVPLVDPAVLGLEFQPIPEMKSVQADDFQSLQPGWYGVCVDQLFRQSNPFPWLRDRRPDIWIGYSVMVFHLGADDIDEFYNSLE